MPQNYRLRISFFTLAALFVTLSCALFSQKEVSVPSKEAGVPTKEADVPSQEWREEFNLADRKLSDTGESNYFILMPGFQTVLESQNAKLIITVLNETRDINGTLTRVVEEKEEIDGELYEISRNFFAIDKETGDVFYFGEEVDFYKNGKITGHKGAWLAYEGENKPGLIMPGTLELGMKYYQELAPGAAMDRAEVISISETFETRQGYLQIVYSRKSHPKLSQRKSEKLMRLVLD